MILFLLQAIEPVAAIAQTAAAPLVPVVVAPTGVAAYLTPPVLLAVGGVLVAIIGALTTAAVTILREVKATQSLVTTSAEVGQKVGAERDQKLDRIEVLVNGRYADVLQELATIKRFVAESTGLEADHLAARTAQAGADAQRDRVAQVSNDYRNRY
jgi:hypothetical protein